MSEHPAWTKWKDTFNGRLRAGLDTMPHIDQWQPCPKCAGTGKTLTEAGEQLVEFVRRRFPQACDTSVLEARELAAERARVKARILEIVPKLMQDRFPVDNTTASNVASLVVAAVDPVG